MRMMFLFRVFAVCVSASAEIMTAGTFTRPFSSDSPWCRPIPANAVYEDVPGLNTIAGGINFADRWTTFVYKTDVKSRAARVYIHDSTLWNKRSKNEVGCNHNSEAIEDALRSASRSTNSFPANYYATIEPSPPGKRLFPLGIRDIHAAWRKTIFVPDGKFTPSPDTDGQIAIWQPDGLVFEAYCAVVCDNGDIICTAASFTDPASDGSGLQNGRCASLIPNYAGLIRAGEVNAGEIPHALACTFPADLLSPRAVYPAAAFDMNDGYKGTVPMGSLIAIPLSVDLSALDLPPKTLVIARAAQRFGIYVVDRGGAGLTVKADQHASDAACDEVRQSMAKIVHELKLVRGVR